jgi:HAMP domain-containing protein
MKTAIYSQLYLTYEPASTMANNRQELQTIALRELSARIKTIMRRASPTRTNALKVGDITLDTKSLSVCRGETEISLTSKEFNRLVARQRIKYFVGADATNHTRSQAC